MLVIFEGVDGVGKGTLLRAFREVTKYAHTEWDRGLLSRLVYAQYFERPLYTNHVLRKEAIKEFQSFVKSMKPLFVYMTADENVLDRRIRSRGEDPSESPNSSAVKRAFEQWIDALGIDGRVLRIDTTIDPDIDSLVKMVTDKIKQLQKKGRK